jgi:hypothetical protein
MQAVGTGAIDGLPVCFLLCDLVLLLLGIHDSSWGEMDAVARKALREIFKLHP